MGPGEIVTGNQGTPIWDRVHESMGDLYDFPDVPLPRRRWTSSHPRRGPSGERRQRGLTPSTRRRNSGIDPVADRLVGECKGSVIC